MYHFKLFFLLFLQNFFTVRSDWANCGYEPWQNMECIKLTECTEVVSYIKRLYTTNTIVHQYFLGQPLWNMTCGFDGYEPKICCSTRKNRIARNIDNQVEQRSSNCGNILWSRSLTGDGQPTELGEFPWSALLEYDLPTGMKYGCGGVLISDRYVLTAAHCLTLGLARVRLGEYNVYTPEDCMYKGSPSFSRYCNDKAFVSEFDKYVVHPGYVSPVTVDSRPNDIALLRLKKPVPFSDFIKPVCLPNDDTIPNKFLSAGWGANIQNKYLRSNVKLNSRLIMVGRKQCEGIYGKVMGGDFICALAKSNRSSCVGDSGGPLMTFDGQSRMVVVGVSTNTNFCQYKGVPGIYIDVKKHKSWILANMK